MSNISKAKKVKVVTQALLDGFTREELRNINRSRKLRTGHQKEDSARILAETMV